MPIGRGILAITAAGVAFSAIAQQFGTGTKPTLENPFPTSTAPSAQGQSGPAPSAQAQPPAPAQGASNNSQVDESALRYFAAQGDTRRVDAEIARLRSLYPNWTPPSDLGQLSTSGQAPAHDPEVDKLWSLYAQDRFADERAEIADHMASDPQWRPPADVTMALDLAEARKRLANASDNEQWRTVLSIATASPSLLTCANVDSLWRVAEAFAKTNQSARTKDVYTYILTNCGNPSERLATLQKALALLPEQQVADLLKLERKSGTEQDDFSAIRDGIVLRRVDRLSVDNKQSASADDLATAERIAQTDDDPGAPLILGWYYYHHNDFEKARQWFQSSFDRSQTSKAAEGLALALRALNRFLEAEDLAYQWRDKSPENMSAYKDIIVATLTQDPPLRLDPRMIASAIPVIAKDRFYNGAQALGWYSYNTQQFQTARDWFTKALSWKADDEASAYGLALSLQRLGDRKSFAALTNAWRGRSQRIADLADGIVNRSPPAANASGMPARSDEISARDAQGNGQAQERSQIYPASLSPQSAPNDQNRTQAVGSMDMDRSAAPQPSYDNRRSSSAAPISDAAPAAVASRSYPQPFISSLPSDRSVSTSSPARGPSARQKCNADGNPYTLPPPRALALGWCLMDLNRPLEAVNAFDQAIQRGPPATKQEAAYGKSLAYLRKDLTREAALAAAEAPQEPKRQVELNATILAQRALAAYRDGRYTEALLALGERDRLVPEQNDLMVIRGYAYFKLGRYDDALKIFQAVQRTGHSDEASAGIANIQEALRPSRQF